MKFNFQQLKKNYNLTNERIIIAFILILLVIIRLIIQKNPEIKFYQIPSNLYSDFLMVISKVFLYFYSQDIIFNFSNNEIINGSSIIKINRFYFSIHQISAIFILVLITKSTFRDRILILILGFLVFSIYNSIRISIHSIYPESIAGNNWLFNILLIPRWIIVLLFYYYYWNKYPSLKQLIISKLNLSDNNYRKYFLNLSFAIIIYFIIIIIAYNNYFFINGGLLAKMILQISRYFIEIFGYSCSIENRTLLGQYTILNMGDACIGIDLMFLFATFIALMPGPAKHKLWFIPMGIVAIVILNAIRVILIFISVSNNNGKYLLPVEIHDAFTYPVLGFTLILWIIWINKFYIIKNVKAKEK